MLTASWAIYYFPSSKMNEFNSVLAGVVIILCVFLITKVLWNRRWLYYYSWVLPGPFSLPMIGSLSLVLSGQKDVLKTGLNVFSSYPSVFRLWLGPEMVISTTKINQVEYILTNCLHKSNVLIYSYFDDVFTSLFTTTFHKWQQRRKNLNRSFNQNILNSYFDAQLKWANVMLKKLELHCGRTHDLMPTVWTTTLDTIFETFGGVDVTTLPEDNLKFISMIPTVAVIKLGRTNGEIYLAVQLVFWSSNQHLLYEELFVERMLNPLYYFDWIWKQSSKFKNLTVSKKLFMNQIRETIRKKKNSEDVAHDSNDFISRAIKGDYSSKDLEEEIAFLMIAGSETVAIVVCSVLLTMSIYPEVQTKLYEEQKQISLLSDGELTLENLNQLDYTERVIKETMRLVTPAPILGRYIDKTIEIDGQVFPEGSCVSIPVLLIHRDPEFWPDPFKFDPDRFLPEEVKKRPRCAYLPFSVGSRNCIGFNYGMTNMKLLLAKIIKNFEVLPSQYKSLCEVETIFHIIQKPRDGFQVSLRQR